MRTTGDQNVYPMASYTITPEKANNLHVTVSSSSCVNFMCTMCHFLGVAIFDLDSNFTEEFLK